VFVFKRRAAEEERGFWITIPIECKRRRRKQQQNTFRPANISGLLFQQSSEWTACKHELLAAKKTNKSVSAWKWPVSSISSSGNIRNSGFSFRTFETPLLFYKKSVNIPENFDRSRAQPTVYWLPPSITRLNFIGLFLLFYILTWLLAPFLIHWKKYILSLIACTVLHCTYASQ